MIGISIEEKAKTSRHARLTVEKKIDAESYEKRSRGAATNDLLIRIRSIRVLYMTGKDRYALYPFFPLSQPLYSPASQTTQL